MHNLRSLPLIVGKFILYRAPFDTTIMTPIIILYSRIQKRYKYSLQGLDVNQVKNFYNLENTKDKENIFKNLGIKSHIILPFDSNTYSTLTLVSLIHILYMLPDFLPLLV